MKIVFLLFFLLSCQSGVRYQKVDPSLAYQSQSISYDWFLPLAPNWLNFSSAHQCEKEYVWTNLDLSKVMPQLGLNYFQSLELQARVNQFVGNAVWSQTKTDSEKKRLDFSSLPDAERSKIFFDELTKVVNNIPLLTPLPESSSEVTIILVDSLPAGEEGKRLLEKLWQLPRWDTEVPVIASECLSTQSLHHIFDQLSSEHPFQWIVGGEYFSTFTASGLPSYQWMIDWQNFFPKKKIRFFREWKELSVVN